MCASGYGDDELVVERSRHGPCFDSFSESCDSREGSRKAGAAGGAVGGAFGSFSGAQFRPFGNSGRHGSGEHAASAWRAGRSLHSGLEFYRAKQQREAERAAPQRRGGGSLQRGSAFQPNQQEQWRPEGSVSRHRGAQFYAEAATRWRAAVESGDPRHVAELERREAQESLEDPAAVAADAPASASVFFDFPETGGSILPARWCHAVASMGERLYVYGGLGLGERPLSDIHFFSVTTNMWRPVHHAGGRKDAPPALWGHAIAASQGKIWVAGGRSTRKLQRKTFCLDTETLAWRALKDSQHAPAGVADLTLTAVAEQGVVAFGGLGSKRASAQLHQLQPATSMWSTLDATGPVPSPRGQHTAVFDGDDQLIVFGGVDTKEAYAAPTVHVLSLSQRRWFSPAVAGEGPGQRARHCAAMLGQNGMRTMAVFGGRCPTGGLLNDVWLLDVASWRWLRGAPLGASPTGRQGAAATVLAGARIAVCGGMSGAGPLDTLLLLSGEFGPELAPLAAQLSLIRRSAPAAQDTGLRFVAEQASCGGSTDSGGAGTDARASRASSGVAAGAGLLIAERPAAAAPAAAAPAASSRSGQEVRWADDGNMAAVQLTELLRRRNVAEAAAEAGRRAHLAERLFQGERKRADALQAEVAQLRLLASEAEQAAADAGSALRDETRRGQRDQGLARAELAAAKKQIQELKAQLSVSQQQAADCMRMREAAVAAAARERTASDAAAAAQAQCASLRRRCGDLSQRLHTQRSAAAAAAADRGCAGGAPPGSPLGHLPSIGEEEAASVVSAVQPPADASTPLPAGLIVRTSSAEAAVRQDGGGAEGVAGGRDGGGSDAAFVESLDSAFERWSMGGAATPPPMPLDGATPADTPTSGVLGMFAAALAAEAPPLERARSAPLAEALPSSPRQQQQQPPPQQRAWPSRHMLGFAPAPSLVRRPSPQAASPRRAGPEDPSATNRRLGDALAALTAERDRGARLAALLTARQQAADERAEQLQRRAALLTGDEATLASATPAELEALEKELEGGIAAARRAAARAAAREAAAESSTCSLCMERPHGVVFGCGHQVCTECSSQRCPTECPFCRATINTRINVFRS